ncbi:MAG: hypothetical protein ACLRV9_02750 [Clostridium sp.]
MNKIDSMLNSQTALCFICWNTKVSEA